MNFHTTPVVRRRRLAVAGIVLVAAAVRLPGLEHCPPPLQQDEASRGYDAWSLLETGADRHGQRWPFFLESFGPGDFTGALSTYLTIPFVAAAGPTVTAMRLPDALCGVLTVLLLYLWLRSHAHPTTALFAAGVLALDPWHVFSTRTAHESGFAPLFLVAGLFSLHRAGLLPGDGGEVQGDDPAPLSTAPSSSQLNRSGAAGLHVGWGSEGVGCGLVWAFIGGVMFALLAWLYPATRLFVPVFVVGVAVVLRQRLAGMIAVSAGRRILAAAAAGALVGGVPLLWTAAFHPERVAARAPHTLIFYQPIGVGDMLARFLKNYALNFDPRYWFFQCDELSGAIVPGVGLHLPILAPAFAIGLLCVGGAARRGLWPRVLLLWLLLAPVPAAVCADWNPHPMRTIAGLPVFAIVTALGLNWLRRQLTLLQRPARRWAAVMAVVAIGVNALHVADGYLRRFPAGAQHEYQTGLVQAFRSAMPLFASADFVLVTHRANQPHIFALLFAPIPPGQYPSLPKESIVQADGFRQMIRVGRFFFMPPYPDREPKAVSSFLEAWSEIPDGSEGLIIAFKGQIPDGRLIERIPSATGEFDTFSLEIRRWRKSDAPAAPEDPGAPEDSANTNG